MSNEVLIAIISTIPVLIGTVAGAVWGSKIASAKDEIIKAKDVQIDTLRSQLEYYRDITPDKLHEWIVGLKNYSEYCIEQLEEQLDDAQKAIKEQDQEIVTLQEEGKAKVEETEKLKLEIDRQQDSIVGLKEEKEYLDRVYESLKTLGDAQFRAVASAARKWESSYPVTIIGTEIGDD